MGKVRSRRLGKALVLILFFSLISARGLDSSFREGNDTQNRVRDYLNDAGRLWNFQGSVLVAKNGKVVFKSGSGRADIDKNILNRAETKFLIASITKTFTAAAVLMLEEEGLLKLSDPIARHLQDFPSETAAKVTIHHLLSHSSGLAEVAADPRSLGDLNQPRTPAELLALFKDRPLEFEPGTRSSYSNSGYVVLGQIIEHASGKSYYDFVREKIFVPLGMKASGAGLVSNVPQLAVGYVEGKDGRLVKAPSIHPSLGYSAGAFYSTVEDLFKWERGLDSMKILSQRSLEKMFTPGRDAFGYGWLILEAWGRKSSAHGGGAPGFASWIERWPDDRIFVAVLSNNGRTPAGEIGRSLAAILLGQDYQLPQPRESVPVDPEVLDEYVGTYRIDSQNVRRVVLQGGALSVEREGGRRYPIVPYAKDRFFFVHDRGAFIRFVRDEEGLVSGHIFHQLGADEMARKLTDLPDRKN